MHHQWECDVGKPLKQANKRLKQRQARFDATTNKKRADNWSGYTRPGSQNKKKGS
jgi:hypothetical protein